MRHSIISRIITITSLLAAVFFPALPYGFYQLLRIIVCGTAVCLAYQASIKGFKAMTWSAIIIAIVFNPLLPLHFSKDHWAVLNFIGALVLAITFLPKYKNHL